MNVSNVGLSRSFLWGQEKESLCPVSPAAVTGWRKSFRRRPFLAGLPTERQGKPVAEGRNVVPRHLVLLAEPAGKSNTNASNEMLKRVQHDKIKVYPK